MDDQLTLNAIEGLIGLQKPNRSQINNMVKELLKSINGSNNSNSDNISKTIKDSIMNNNSRINIHDNEDTNDDSSSLSSIPPSPSSNNSKPIIDSDDDDDTYKINKDKYKRLELIENLLRLKSENELIEFLLS